MSYMSEHVARSSTTGPKFKDGQRVILRDPTGEIRGVETGRIIGDAQATGPAHDVTWVYTFRADIYAGPNDPDGLREVAEDQTQEWPENAPAVQFERELNVDRDS